MSHEWLSLDELALHLGRDRRELERLTQRGRIPGHKRGADWHFHQAEVTEWLEQEMRDYSDSQLAAFETANPSERSGSIGSLMRFMSPELIQVPLDARTKRSVLECLVETASRTWKVWEPATVLKALIERESLMSTAFDSGVAIPHPRQPLVDTLEESVVAFGRTFSPIPFGAPNNAGTDLFFLVLCRDARTHLQVLARIGRLIQGPNALERLRSSENNSEAFATLQALEAAIDAA